jgi:hypothetical protein
VRSRSKRRGGSPHRIAQLLRFLPDRISISASPPCAHVRTKPASVDSWIPRSPETELIVSISSSIGGHWLKVA